MGTGCGVCEPQCALRFVAAVAPQAPSGEPAEEGTNKKHERLDMVSANSNLAMLCACVRCYQVKWCAAYDYREIQEAVNNMLSIVASRAHKRNCLQIACESVPLCRFTLALVLVLCSQAERRWRNGATIWPSSTTRCVGMCISVQSLCSLALCRLAAGLGRSHPCVATRTSTYLWQQRYICTACIIRLRPTLCAC